MGPYCGFCTRRCSVRYPDGTLPCIHEEARLKKEEDARFVAREPAEWKATESTEITSQNGNDTA